MVDGRALKYLALSISCNEEELVVWREGDRCDHLSKVEMCQDYSLDHIDDESEAINIDADQGTAIW